MGCMDLKTYLSNLDPDERQAFIERCGTSIQSLRNVIDRERCGPGLAVRIEQHSGGKVTRKDLRPHDYAAIWPELAMPAAPKKARHRKTAAA